jgi:hypothetical protein
MIDPLNDFLTFFLQKAKNSTLALWWRLIFEMVFSSIVSFETVCGVTLVSGGRPSLAVGNGLIASAVALTYLFRKESSRLTKGMLVVLPELEAEKELNSNLQTIQKAEK